MTFDGDGQHNPRDARKVLEFLKSSKLDLVVGVRCLQGDKMPWVKKVGNWFLNLWVNVFFGVKSGDSQSGLRAFNKKALDCIKVKTTRYEVSSEILLEAQQNGLRVGEVPVEVIYTNHSMSNGTGVMDGWDIFFRMLLHKFRK